MSDVTIFKNPNAGVPSTLAPSRLGAVIASNMGGYNRIATNTNGTFKRILKGEQVGKAIRGEFNAIIVDMLESPGRTYYAGVYDPDAKGTKPDCYSDIGVKPETSAESPQSSNCAICPKNVDGSGQNGKGKACRFSRKVALFLEGDNTGDLYQFNIPAKSLFGKGSGKVHPFESYTRYLASNKTGPDQVVTTIAYNLDAETMELTFTADRYITAEEQELVLAAQDNPATRRLIVMDSVKAAPKAETPPQLSETKAKAAVVIDEDEDEEETPAEPVKRASKKETASVPEANLAKVVNAWMDEDDGDDDEDFG